MRINKKTLLLAAKRSTSVEDMARVLSKEENECEKIWERMLRVCPGAEDYLTRNECIYNMRMAFMDEDWETVAYNREEYMIATWNLMKNGFIKVDRDVVSKFLGKLACSEPVFTMDTKK